MEDRHSGDCEHPHSSPDGTGYYQLHGPRPNHILNTHRHSLTRRTDSFTSAVGLFYICLYFRALQDINRCFVSAKLHFSITFCGQKLHFSITFRGQKLHFSMISDGQKLHFSKNEAPSSLVHTLPERHFATSRPTVNGMTGR